MHTGIDGVDVVHHLGRLAIADKLHRGLTSKTLKGLRPIPGIGDQGRAEARFDAVQDLDHLAQSLLCLGTLHPIRPDQRVTAKADGARDLVLRGPQDLGNAGGGEEAAFGKGF